MSDEELIEFAKRLEHVRAQRDRFFPSWLLGEPGFSILLELFVTQSENRYITVSSACLGANIPQTTGLRWIKKLESAGFIERHPHPNDRRLQIVRLSRLGRERMVMSLREIQAKVQTSVEIDDATSPEGIEMARAQEVVPAGDELRGHASSSKGEAACRAQSRYAARPTVPRSALSSATRDSRE